MNYVDIVIVVFALWFGYKGFRKGLVIEVASLASLVIGIYGAIKLSGLISAILQSQFHFESEYRGIIAFAITFIIIVIFVHFIARLANKLVKAVALNFINKLAGAVFGVLKIILIFSILFWFINKIDMKTNFMGEDVKNRSLLYQPIAKIATTLYPVVEDIDFNLSSKE